MSTMLKLKPRHFIEIERFVEEGIPMSHYLQALFANDLLGAVSRGDDEMMSLLREYIRYISNNTPPDCRGSWDAVKEWRGTNVGR